MLTPPARYSHKGNSRTSRQSFAFCSAHGLAPVVKIGVSGLPRLVTAAENSERGSLGVRLLHTKLLQGFNTIEVKGD